MSWLIGEPVTQVHTLENKEQKPGNLGHNDGRTRSVEEGPLEILPRLFRHVVPHACCQWPILLWRGEVVGCNQTTRPRR